MENNQNDNEFHNVQISNSQSLKIKHIRSSKLSLSYDPQILPYLIKSTPSDMDLFHLGLQIKYFPLFRILQSATKLVTTDQWKTAWKEIKLFRTLNKFEQLREQGLITVSNPSTMNSALNLNFRSHSHNWNTLLEEMQWMSVDFHMERTWKQKVANQISSMISKDALLHDHNSLIPTISKSPDIFDFHHSKDLDYYLTQVNTACFVYGPPKPSNVIDPVTVQIPHINGLFSCDDLPKKGIHPSSESSHISPPWSRIEDDFISNMIEDCYQDESEINWRLVADYINSQYHRGQYVRNGLSVKSRYFKHILPIQIKKSHRMTIEDKKNYIVRQFENLMYSFAIMKKRPRLRTFTKYTPNSSQQNIITKKALLNAHASHEAAIRKVLVTRDNTNRSQPPIEQSALTQLSATPEELVAKKIQRTKAIMEMHQAASIAAQSPRPVQHPYHVATPPQQTASTPNIPSIPTNTPIPNQPIQYYQQPPIARPVHPVMVQGQQQMMLMMVRPTQRPIAAQTRPVPIITSTPRPIVSESTLQMQQSPIAGLQGASYYYQQPSLPNNPQASGSPINLQYHGMVYQSSPKPMTPIAPASPAKEEKK